MPNVRWQVGRVVTRGVLHAYRDSPNSSSDGGIGCLGLMGLALTFGIIASLNQRQGAVLFGLFAAVAIVLFGAWLLLEWSRRAESRRQNAELDEKLAARGITGVAIGRIRSQIPSNWIADESRVVVGVAEETGAVWIADTEAFKEYPKPVSAQAVGQTVLIMSSPTRREGIRSSANIHFDLVPEPTVAAIAAAITELAGPLITTSRRGNQVMLGPRRPKRTR